MPRLKKADRDFVEQLDDKFKKQCAERADEERSRAHEFRKRRADIAAAACMVRAAVYDELALQGFAVMDD